MAQPRVEQNSSLIQAREGSRETTQLFDVILIALAGVAVPSALAYGLAVGNELQVIAIAGAVMGLILILARPFVGLLLFIGLLYVRPEESIKALAGMHLPLVICLITIVGLVFKLFLEKTPLVRTPIVYTMIGLFCSMLLSGFVGGTGMLALQDGGRLLLLVLLVLNLCRTPQNYRILITTIIVFTVYLAAYSTYLYYTGTATMDDGIARSRGTGIFSDPNDLAATMVAGLALAFTRVLQGSLLQRGFYALLSATMCWAILLTNSRGGLLALIVMIVAFLFTFTPNKKIAVGIAVAAAAIVLALAPSRMKNFDHTEESANNRIGFWQEGLSQLRQHPFTGVGYLKFPEVNGGFVAHNSYVHCFAELGLLGYFCWIGCIYFAFAAVKKQPISFEPIPPIDDHAAPENRFSHETNTMFSSGADRNPTKGADKTAETIPSSIDPIAQRADLLGTAVALTGYLTACFFISRNYTPLTYLLFAVPIARQFAFTNKSTLIPADPLPTTKALSLIGVVCFTSIILVWLITWKLG